MGHTFAKHLVELDLETGCLPESFAYEVHSGNPVGRANIKRLLSGYLAFRRGGPTGTSSPYSDFTCENERTIMGDAHYSVEAVEVCHAPSPWDLERPHIIISATGIVGLARDCTPRSADCVGASASPPGGGSALAGRAPTPPASGPRP